MLAGILSFGTTLIAEPARQMPFVVTGAWIGAADVSSEWMEPTRVGVSIAKQVDFQDAEENLCAQTLRQAAERTGQRQLIEIPERRHESTEAETA